MLHRLINHSPDLKRLVDEGYEIEIKNGHLLVHHVPYVNKGKKIAFGMLISPIGDLAGDRLMPPDSHVIYFNGTRPCDKYGRAVQGIFYYYWDGQLAEGVAYRYAFSNRPDEGFADYYEKVTNYVRILESHAQSVDPSATARTFRTIASEEISSVFHYYDTNSTRAEISTISDKLKEQAVAIIGLGGTGSYVLDFVAKTQVREIHLFDADELLTHNAFRVPGAAPLEVLRTAPTKVGYLHGIYSNMHKCIVAHPYQVYAHTLDELPENTFVFLCIDDGYAKQSIVKTMIEKNIPFVDVGIGIQSANDRLMGNVRVTSVTPEKSDHVERRISFGPTRNGEYDKNIQISEINALNAIMAVIKWKKRMGFYHDLVHEHHTIYDIGTNKLFNDEISPPIH